MTNRTFSTRSLSYERGFLSEGEEEGEWGKIPRPEKYLERKESVL